MTFRAWVCEVGYSPTYDEMYVGAFPEAHEWLRGVLCGLTETYGEGPFVPLLMDMKVADPPLPIRHVVHVEKVDWEFGLEWVDEEG